MVEDMLNDIKLTKKMSDRVPITSTHTPYIKLEPTKSSPTVKHSLPTRSTSLVPLARAPPRVMSLSRSLYVKLKFPNLKLMIKQPQHHS